jgi:Rrf2 family transcriptional regulator, iron-sulfur cluster assembly transcription factor
VKYTQSTELAVDSLLFMAAHSERQEFSVDEVARAQSISGAYLSKVFQQLVRAGILRSHRGAKGGYALARSPREITLLDAALVFEGSAPIYTCRAESKLCQLGSRCLVMSTFRKAEEQLHEALRDVTLQDLLDQLRAHSQGASCLGTGVA